MVCMASLESPFRQLSWVPQKASKWATGFVTVTVVVTGVGVPLITWMVVVVVVVVKEH